MAIPSRLPRCIIAGARRSMIANGMRSRAFSTAPPPAPPPQQQQKPVSKHIGFYKEFGRPIMKVFLMAFFTYQTFYWVWVKLEKEEVKRGKEEEITGLLGEVERLKSGAKNR